MQRPLLVVIVSVLLSTAASFVVVSLQRPSTSQPAVQPAAATLRADAVSSAELRALQSALDELAMEVALLREQRASDRRAVSALEEAEAAGAPGEADATGRENERGPREWAALGSGPGGSDAFRAQVEEVLAQVEEEREAERWEEELEERREESVKANEEYDQFETELETRLVDLQDKLGLGVRQVNDLRGHLAVQNDRNREMTRLWSEGNTSKEELGRIFMENRTAHRDKIMALLEPDQIGSFRKYMREGGLGGRFSYFVAPWEDWNENGR